MKSASLAKTAFTALCVLSLFSAGCCPNFSDADSSASVLPSPSTIPAYLNEAPAEFSDWEEAYRYVLNHHRDFIPDPLGYQRAEWEKPDSRLRKVDVIGIATHDFDGDGTPELILSSYFAPVVLYSFREGRLEQSAVLPLDDRYICGDVLPYINENTVTLVQEYSRCQYRYVICGYVEGAYRVGTYEEHPPLRSTVDGQTVSAEELLQIFPSLQKNISQSLSIDDRIDRYCIDSETHELKSLREAQDDSYFFDRGEGFVFVDESFDLSLFAR